MVAISEAVSLENNGEVGILWINNPPVNALGYPVRKGLLEGISMAMENDRIQAIVVICKGQTFCAGADIREMGKPPVEPHLPDVLSRFDQSTKPIIAALHGTAFGGGLEMALACHFRIALPTAHIGLPEVKLGLLPAAGGTQRLPRLIGPEKALNMILSGDPMDAETAFGEGVIDEIVGGNLADAATLFAKKVLKENRPLIRVSNMEGKTDAARNKPDFFDYYRRKIANDSRGFEAPKACIKAMEAAVHLPFAEGCKIERELFFQLRSGSQSAAQRYYFFAERQAAKVPDIPKGTSIKEIRTVGVIGAGTMGKGITMSLIDAGIPVTLVEIEPLLLDQALEHFGNNYNAAVAKGKMHRADADACMGRITGTINLADLAEVDLVIEAVFEKMDLKKKIFFQLDAVCKEDAILATSTSWLDVNVIASLTRRPESVIGLHFFRPANATRLLEIVRARKTTKSVLSTALDLAKRLEKIAVVVGVCRGFAANRMYFQHKRECDRLILEGASPVQIDRVLYEFGFPMGPFALYGLGGNDQGWCRENSGCDSIRDMLCEAGRLGTKSGKGYYNYDKDRRVPRPAPEVDRMVISFSKKKGYSRRKLSDEEILQRCIYSIINEGARILEEKIVLRPSDLDIIWVNGFGWPPYRGGPMFYADMVGLDKILDVLDQFQAVNGDDYKPASLLEKLSKKVRGFSSLNTKIKEIV